MKSKIPQLKSKPKYKDAPRFDIIYDYEGLFKKKYNKSIEDGVRAFSSKYAKIIKDQE